MEIIEINDDFYQKNSDEIIRNWLRIWDDSPWQNLAKDDKKIDKYFKRVIKSGIFLLAKDKNEIISYLLAFYNSHQETLDRQNDYEIKLYKDLKNIYKKYTYLADFVLHKNYRNKGLGSKIFEKFLTKLQENKVKVIILYTEKNSLSQNLYKRIGFEKFGKTNRVEDTDLEKDFEERVYYIKKL